MIIWIASYPGSGDEMLIHALHERFGFVWYEADLLDQSHLDQSTLHPATGQRSANGKWRKIYEKALDSERIILARTRMPPSDGQPFIYVSRKGDGAIRSFHHCNFQGDPNASVGGLILGHYLYGNWTSHYESWKNHPHSAQGVFVKIEDFVANTNTFWDEIAGIIHTPAKGEITFDPGQVMASRLESAPGMTDDEATLYHAFHGESEIQRGYAPSCADPFTPPDHIPALPVRHLVASHRKSAGLLAQLHEMQSYIDSLQCQLTEETTRLRDYIGILKQEIDTLKGKD